MSIPKNVVIPQSSGQFGKIQEGANRFRVLSDARPNINYFWAMTVWNYKENKVQVLTITQKTIMGALVQLEENTEDFGDLKNYDIIINKSKVGDKTSYTVQGTPSKPLTEEIKTAFEESKVDLSKLFDGKYPMGDEEEVPF